MSDAMEDGEVGKPETVQLGGPGEKMLQQTLRLKYLKGTSNYSVSSRGPAGIRCARCAK